MGETEEKAWVDMFFKSGNCITRAGVISRLGWGEIYMWILMVG